MIADVLASSTSARTRCVHIRRQLFSACGMPASRCADWPSARGVFADVREGSTSTRGVFADFREGSTTTRRVFADVREGSTSMRGVFAEIREGSASTRGVFADVREYSTSTRGVFADVREGFTSTPETRTSASTGSVSGLSNAEEVREDDSSSFCSTLQARATMQSTRVVWLPRSVGRRCTDG